MYNRHKTPKKIKTSGGTTATTHEGVWAFSLRLVDQTSSPVLKVENTSCLPNSGFPILSLHVMKRDLNAKIDIDLEIVTINDLEIKIVVKNGIYGFLGRRKNSNDAGDELILQGYSTYGNKVNAPTDAKPGKKAAALIAYKLLLPTAEEIDAHDKSDFLESHNSIGEQIINNKNLITEIQINENYFDWLNEIRGAFTHHAFTLHEDQMTPEMLSVPDVNGLDATGLSVIFTPKIDMENINEFLNDLFIKLHDNFQDAIHDGKYLIVAPYSPRALWWTHTCRYEIVDRVAVGTQFYTTRDWESSAGGAVIKPSPFSKLHGNKYERYECEPTKRELVILYRDINTPIKINKLMLLHLRLGHFSSKYLKSLIEQEIPIGIDVTIEDIKKYHDIICESCKSQKLLQTVKRTNQDFSSYGVFEYVCMDGSGPMPYVSLHGNVYVWAIMCLKSRWVRLYFSKNKTASDIKKILEKFLDYVKFHRGTLKDLGVTYKLLTDLGTEFKNKTVAEWCAKEGIRHDFAATAMHHQNAHIERNFRTIWSATNRMMWTATAPVNLWEEMCTHAVFIRNRLGHPALDMKTPYFVRFNKNSKDLERCRIFYSPCWPVTDAYYNKFSAATEECKWVGINETVRGTLVYRPSDKLIFTAGMLHVYENSTEAGKLFNDIQFTAHDIQDTKTYKELIWPKDFTNTYRVRKLTKIHAHRCFWDEQKEVSFGLLKIETRSDSEPFWVKLENVLTSEKGKYFDDVWTYLINNDFGENFPIFSTCTHVHGIKNPTNCILFEYDKTDVNPFSVAFGNGKIQCCKRSNILEIKDKNILSTFLSQSQMGGDMIDKKCPKNRSEARKRHDWPSFEAAEKEELKRAVEFTYLTDFTNEKPTGCFVHTTRFVYQIAFYTDGTLNKYKVRLIFRGFTMEFNRDYFDTYAPVTQIISMKLFFYICLYYGLKTGCYDVKSAFLQADMDTEVWCSLPDGFTYDGCRYARVNRAIPGVKQGAYLWFRKFVKTLLADKFKQADVEPCLFIYWDENDTRIFLLIHVDNVIVGTNNEDAWKKMIAKWDFQIDPVDNVSILGLHVERISKYKISFSQENYIKELIMEFGLQDLPSAHIPIRAGIEADYDPSTMSRTIDPAIPYRRLNMKLYWIARCFRVHILYACNFFSRFSHCYDEKLFKEMLKVVLYLKGTIEWKLIFKVDPSVPPDITFACDADFANAKDRRSTFGSLGWVGRCLVYGQSNSIKTLVTSSTESESHGIFESAKACEYLKMWLSEFTRIKIPNFIFNDNQAAIQLLSTRNNSGLSKHFDVKLRYVTSRIEAGMIKIFHIPRGLNGADILTHSLPRATFEKLLVIIYGAEGLSGLLDAAAISSGGELEWRSSLTEIYY